MEAPSFYEFFAGGGMVRLALTPEWRCSFANEYSPAKARSYRLNFEGAPELCVADVRSLCAADLPRGAALAWASFPCQDLSLAGAGRGLAGERSGVFFAFWKLMRELDAAGARTPLIALENVVGLVSSHGGRDLAALVDALGEAGYRAGALVIDGARFTPQSRPRLFILGVDADLVVPGPPFADAPSELWHPPALRRWFADASEAVRGNWIWIDPGAAPPTAPPLAKILEADAGGWRPAAETKRLLEQMTADKQTRIADALARGETVIATVFRRTRPDGDGGRAVRAEPRFDGVAGCLRTPAGGSSRQILLIGDAQGLRSRLLTPRETARLMGLGDRYALPERANEAYRLTGDGVVVPAVRFLSERALLPLARRAAQRRPQALQR